MLLSDAACKWTDPSHPLAWDCVGDPSQNPLPLPDPEPEPDKPDELKELHLDLRSDPEPLPEQEELDHEQCGERDLAHLRLVGEWGVDDTGGEVGGMTSLESLPASHPVCLGAVEVEGDGPVLIVAAAFPPVLWRMASFNTSSAFL